MAVLEARDVSKSFGGRTVLDHVSLRLDDGKLVSLLGVSGVGKSTLFSILAGLLAPDEGQVLLRGEDVTGRPGGMAYMQQRDLLLPHLRILDNVSLPLRIRGKNRRAAREEAEPWFSAFGLEGTQRLFPAQMSGGMRQRAALLRTWLFGGAAALLDEPFSALDALTKTQMHAWYLDVLRRCPMPTLFITHDIDEALLLSDRIYILSGEPGKISAELPVPLARPRNTECTFSPEFLGCKREILGLLGV